MKKQMKRTVYEAPVTERFSVELEGAMMSASVVQDTGSSVTATGQESGGEWDMSNGGTDDQFTVTWE
ncbi:MAG: hypothetical protein IJE11_01475 [Bacteroidales bacterium]|nr:hypothetical protein [Bacteroidales bacterium]